mgnify:FL=1|tara:strand:- start:7359 stop:7511 length:153 start_codon:yes stop_codon:yes gene_type:complete
MTPPELAALVELLNRIPMTAAEKLWCQALVERLAKAAETSADVAEEAKEE